MFICEIKMEISNLGAHNALLDKLSSGSLIVFVVTVDIQLKTRMKWDFSMELFVEILTSMNLENCRIDNVLPDPRNRHAGF
jgi:hypothetical protein